MSQLTADCLYDILEYFEDDNATLFSCLLVNRLWCEVAVTILWRNGLKYNTKSFIALIACLPKESIKILYDKGITIPTQDSKLPMFNYAAFCKSLSIYVIKWEVRRLFQRKQLIGINGINDNYIHILMQEILKLFMSQISLLKYLYIDSAINTLTIYPGAENCLRDLSELSCSSSHSNLVYQQLSQICHNLLSLQIIFHHSTSNGLADLISTQKNLKYLSISVYHDLTNIIRSLTNLPNILTHLTICGGGNSRRSSIPLSFITRLTNLQVLKLLLYHKKSFEEFEKLQYTTFSQLKTLEFKNAYPKCELLINFLEINGINLWKFYIDCVSGVCDNSLNLAVAKFCLNLRRLSVGFKNDESLKIVFNSCQYLESIVIWCGRYGEELLNEKDALEIVVKYSPESFCQLTLNYIGYSHSILSPEELESYFVIWASRSPQKSLSLIISGYYGGTSLDKNMEIINKYIELGIIKKFNRIRN